MARKYLSPLNLGAELQANGSAGTIGQVLTSGGSGTVPTWTSISTSGLSASSQVAQGRLTADTSVTPNADLVIPFVDDFDPQNWWDPSTKKFIPNVAGYYSLTLQVWWTIAAVTNNQNNIQIRKNGNTVVISQTQTLSGNGYSQNATKLVYLHGSTDYIDFTAYTGNSSAQSIQWGGNSNGQGTFFSAVLMTAGVGPAGATGAAGPVSVSYSATAPSSPVAGLQWVNTTDGRSYTWSGTEWFESYGNLSGTSYLQSATPSTTVAGSPWYNTNDGRFYVWSGTEWFEPTINAAGTNYLTSSTPSTTVPGTQWYNTNNGRYYVWSGSEWFEANSNLTGPTGITSVTSPITNSGTSTSAILGIDQGQLVYLNFLMMGA